MYIINRRTIDKDGKSIVNKKIYSESYDSALKIATDWLMHKTNDGTNEIKIKYNNNLNPHYKDFVMSQDDFTLSDGNTIKSKLIRENFNKIYKINKKINESKDTTTMNNSSYTIVDSKYVKDEDGFTTEYTWYKGSNGLNIFMFGDSDLYEPCEEYSDFSTENDEEAKEWFDSYDGFSDDDDDDYKYYEIESCHNNKNKKNMVESIKAKSYYDKDLRGVEDWLESDDIEKIIEFVWEKLCGGSFIQIIDDNGNRIDFDQNDFDLEDDMASEYVRNKIIDNFYGNNKEIIESMDNDDYDTVDISNFGDDGKSYAYNLEFIKKTGRSIWAESRLYGDMYRIDLKDNSLYKNGTKISDYCEYSLT